MSEAQNIQKEEPKDGVIKYQCNWVKGSPLDFEKEVKQLDIYRQKLYDIKLIGAYPGNIGYGNISYIKENKEMIITGSATGTIQNLNENHYCVVNNFDLEKNCLTCTGPLKASSESMTHGAVYEADSNIKAVVHIHNYEMWKYLLHKIPTTSKDALYGTPEIAKEVTRLFKETDVKEKKIFVLEGHEDGIFTFGENLQEAYDVVYKYYQEILKNDEQLLETIENKEQVKNNEVKINTISSNTQSRSRSRSRSRSQSKSNSCSLKYQYKQNLVNDKK